MADIKKLFEKQKGQQILADATLNKVGAGVESADYVKVNVKDKNRFVPYINFASASNFARYGLAEKYYEDSIDYISNEYPYDGSEREKINWHLSSSYLDRHIFENEYPRTNGYINFGLEYGTTSAGADPLKASSKLEYIQFFGNNTATAPNVTPNQKLSLNFENLRLYNTASQGISNLELDGNNGFGVEFWFKKNGWYPGESEQQVFVDIWNSSSVSPVGLFRISALSGTSEFTANIISGSVRNTITLGSGLEPYLGGTSNTWNHWAFMFVNAGSNLVAKLYQNGNLIDTDTSGLSIGKITGSMIGNIGATTYYGDGTIFGEGFGKLSGSLDEFRFWKRERSIEQVGRHWFTQVGGGTNTDITNAVTASTKYSYENPVDLGFYYKFNEGIFNTSGVSSQDALILDYAGRVTNGSWTGYSAGARSTNSAIVESSASLSEFKDPIIYSNNPDVVSLRNTKKEEGQLHDYQNNANIYHSIPSWILEEDEDNAREPLKDLTQIMASYFDTLHLQIKSLPEIKNVRYPTGSDKPYPFADRLINSLGLVTSDIFSNATDLEYLASRNDHQKFAKKLNETKNNIYQNIYNNLIYIYKSKGTEKSFRNLIRCFGVGEELVNINLYGNDITHEFKNNIDFRTIKKRYADFHNSLRFSSTVFQQSSSTNNSSRKYIESSITSSWGGNTYEAETIFPVQLYFGDTNYVQNDFIPSSIFGCHTLGNGNSWGTTDAGNFQVQSVRSSIYSKDAYFRLTGTTDYQLGELTSSIFRDVYDDTKWNFAVRVKPSKYPLAPSVSGSGDSTSADTFDLDFLGYNYVLDKLVNSFKVTSSVSRVNALNFLSSSKRFFLGAHRQDFTSSTLQKSDAKISSMRVWMSPLEDQTIEAHAQDAENFGAKYPYKSSYISQYGQSLNEAQIVVPQMETLILNWDFDTLSSSNASGEFIVPDASTRPINYYKYDVPGTLYSSDCITWKNVVNFVADGCGGVWKNAGGAGWNSWANADPIGANDAATFRSRFHHGYMWEAYAGLHTSEGAFGDEGLIAYAFYFDAHVANAVVIQEAGSDPTGGLSWTLNTTDYFRIIRGSFGEVFYQRSTDGGVTYSTIYTSTVKTTGDLYPVVTAENASVACGLTDATVEQGDPISADWGWLGQISQYQYTGLGYGFPVSDTGSISREFVYSAKQRLPETLNSSDMISLIDEDVNQMFTKDSRPIDYSFAFEKSMNSIVSEQMINYFGTIIAFNNLVGEPVNRYRQDYKDLDKLRALYFERVQNTPDFEKFVEFFKWIDDAVGLMLVQLAPASARVSEKLRNVIESHILERNKYWNKFPTLEMKGDDPEAGLRGINELLYSGKRGIAPIPTTATASNCEWWYERAERDNSNITSGDSTIDGQRNTYRMANDFRSANGSTLAVSRDSTETTTTYEGNVYATRNFTKPYKLSLKEMPELHGGSNTARIKNMQYAHTELPFGKTTQLKVSASSIDSKIDCNDVIDPSSKYKLSFKLINNPTGYKSGRGEIFAPFNLYSSSVNSGYASDLSTNFKANTDLTDYHNDVYGDDQGIPAQGPFTEKYVGGWVHRHVPFPNTDCPAATGSLATGSLRSTPQCRPEAWNLTLIPASNLLTLSPRTAHQARSTILREPLAKRPVNIRNIKQTTGSTVIGNYSHEYEVVQTSGRKINNRFFVKNEGFNPTATPSTYIDGLTDYPLPRYDLIGKNKFIFVERFNAPGGPEVSSRGSMDINAEEMSVYNDLNQRNSIVRNALNSWQTDHCGQFGIVSVSGAIQGYRQPRWQDYNTLANYHKVNKNAGRPYAWVKDFSREVEFPVLGEFSFDGITQTYSIGVVGGALKKLKSDQEIGKFGYFEIELTDNSPSPEGYAMGISPNSSDPIVLNIPPSAVVLWDFGWHIWEDGTPYIGAYEGTNKVAEIDGFAIGDKVRIVKNGTQIIFQYKSVSSNNFTDIYTSNNTAVGTYYPRVAFDSSNSSFKNPRISNPQYDNWYIQHAIPQSDLQYSWINDSYDRSKDQPFGHASKFSIPSGTTSTTASVIQFVTAACWEPTPIDYHCFWDVNFAQYLWIFAPLTSNVSWYKYTITGSQNMLNPGGLFTTNGASIGIGHEAAPTIQGHFNNINGPYGYPSWKQIRTGETPVARYQKRNNILSIMSPPRLIELANGNGPGIASVFFNSKMDTYKQFIEPPVVFKHKALNTIIGQQNGVPLKLRHSYGNNKCMFSQAPVTTLAEVGSSRASASIADYLNIPEENPDIQIYDLMRSDPDVYKNVASNLYSEVVYPREVNTGLAKTRGRTQYAEIADLISPPYRPSASVLGYYGLFVAPTASLSNGDNGIDRGPLYRRTFWRDSSYDRNRYGIPFTDSNYITADSCTADTCIRFPQNWFSTTILNSCGNKDGHARSVWCFGESPLVWRPITKGSASYLGGILSSSNPGAYGAGLYLGADNTWSIDNLGIDTGELNSINIMKIGGLMGGVSGSTHTASYAYGFYNSPSASAYYYWLPYYGVEMMTSGSDDGRFIEWGGDFTMALSKGMKWTAARDSGKKPWFDSYEEYADDIRGLSKAWTILPEFKISEQMPYYVETRGGNFRYQNDKFLSLNGASITQSADTESTSNNVSDYNQNFFKEYSNSDFQKYFGKFSVNTKSSTITLKCNVVKKLLPYKGFYPMDRTTQMVSLFSGALGKYVMGGALSASDAYAGGTLWRPDVSVGSGSEQLALQSLLQPWFAPGILYNTIKSGIAVDWPVITGSTLRGCEAPYLQGFGFIGGNASARFPFTSLLEPLSYIPRSGSAGAHMLQFLAPSYMFSQSLSQPMRIPYAEFINPGTRASNGALEERVRPDNSVLNLYSSAMHNYLAEIPNFFLKDQGLQTIESLPQDQITIGEGEVYVMDIYLEKTNTPGNELVMIEDYYNGSISASFVPWNSASTGLDPQYNFASSGTVWGTNNHRVTASYNGKYFGPIWNCKGEELGGSCMQGLIPDGADWYEFSSSNPAAFPWDGKINVGSGRACDPGHAPHTPPYFYGKAKVKLIYTGSAEDADRTGAGKGPNFRRIFNNMTMSYKNLNDERLLQWTQFSGSGFDHPLTAVHTEGLNTPADRSRSAAFKNMMDITASLKIKEIKVDDPDNDGLNKWIIKPFMETPVLDFSSSQIAEPGYGKGMWSGYGEIPTNNKGIYFGIERSADEFYVISDGGMSSVETKHDMTEWFVKPPANDPTGIKQMLRDENTTSVSRATRRSVGNVANIKKISEAIVAIPFVSRRYRSTSINATTTKNSFMGDKYFFSLWHGRSTVASSASSRFIFNEQRNNTLEKGEAIPLNSRLAAYYDLKEVIPTTSISKMALLMDKYIIPPQLDFNKYSDIEPFAMYIIEFEHELDQQDLSDIWQGLMPKISTTAELDSQQYGHDIKPWEFFAGQLPDGEDLRWMVFKVKRKANVNYWNIGPSSKDLESYDSTQFQSRRRPGNQNPFGLDYSYNWPYDYFSLVELAQIEVKNKFIPGGGPRYTVTEAPVVYRMDTEEE